MHHKRQTVQPTAGSHTSQRADGEICRGICCIAKIGQRSQPWDTLHRKGLAMRVVGSGLHHSWDLLGLARNSRESRGMLQQMRSTEGRRYRGLGTSGEGWETLQQIWETAGLCCIGPGTPEEGRAMLQQIG